MDLLLSELGKKSAYKTTYDASLLFAIPRVEKRDELGIKGKPDFQGVDIWTAFEVSWLDCKGKPQVRIATFVIDAHSPNIIESKSFKLYLNSFNNSQFDNDEAVRSTMKQDLQSAAKSEVVVKLYRLSEYPQMLSNTFPGVLLDDLDVEIATYMTGPKYLKTEGEGIVSEVLSSDLLKSNCLVTDQPDWGSVMIEYEGKKINHEGLLKYIISFRNHNEFHEQCVERIYTDILKHCQPQKLLVYARYTRRGGLDINPVRSNFEYHESLNMLRLVRQ